MKNFLTLCLSFFGALCLTLVTLNAGAQTIRRVNNNVGITGPNIYATLQLAHDAAVAGDMMKRNPNLAVEYKLLLKDSPCFVGIAKGEDALKAKVNEIIAAARKDG